MASRLKAFQYRIALVLAFVTFPQFADTARAQGKAKLEIVPILGHIDQVSSVAFSPEGARVLSGSHDNKIKLWDAATGALIRTF